MSPGELSGKLSIAAGRARASFYVTPLEDRFKELRETVKVTILKNALYHVGAPASATVTIADND